MGRERDRWAVKWFHFWVDYCFKCSAWHEGFSLPLRRFSQDVLQVLCACSAKMLNAKVLEELLRPHSDLAPPVTPHVTKPKNPTLPVPTTAACNIYLSFRLLRFPFIYSLFFLFNFAQSLRMHTHATCGHAEPSHWERTSFWNMCFWDRVEMKVRGIQKKAPSSNNQTVNLRCHHNEEHHSYLKAQPLLHHETLSGSN